MWAAVGASIPLTAENFQQTWPDVAFRFRLTMPWPPAGPFGTSDLPVSFALSSGCIAVPPPSAAGTAVAATAIASGNSLLIATSSIVGRDQFAAAPTPGPI